MGFRDARLFKAKKYVDRADLSQLPKTQQVAIEQVFFTELSMAEIGHKLGISRQAVKQRVEAGLVALGIWEPLGTRAGPQSEESRSALGPEEEAGGGLG